MDEHNILDAPERDGTQLKISYKVVLFAIIGMAIMYSIFFRTASFSHFTKADIKSSIFTIDLKQLIFLATTSMGLYFFMSFIKFEIAQWFRVMTVSVTIVLVATLLSLLLTLSASNVELFQSVKVLVFIALIAGGGCSLATQFLHKKHYFIFSAIMICTIVFFSLIEFL
jgi:hypothetical protein